MSDSSTTSTASTSPVDTEAFASQFPFAALRFAASDKRRKMAAKFEQHSMPTDVAAAAVTLYRSNADNPTLPEPRERTNPREDALPVLPRLRVIVPLMEPNVLPMGRCHALFAPKPRVEIDENGVWQVHWSTVGDHEAATRAAHERYLSTHEVTGQLGRGESPLDTWHDPFLLAAVRHLYGDDTKPQTRWMCVNGNARLHGARIALAADLSRWGVEHPWTDPGAMWAADMATVRTAVAAARTVLAGADRRALGWSHTSAMTEQWADLILPAPERTKQVVDNWLFHEHNTSAPEDDTAYPVSDRLDEWLRSVDVFAGLDADGIANIVGVDVATREGREEVAATEEEVDTFLRAVSVNKDTTATRIALAAAALAATPTHDPSLGRQDPQESFAAEDWWVKGGVFYEYALRATSKNRASTARLASDLNTVRHYLSTTRSFPDCDLYGIFGDLRAPVYEGGPLTDPTSDWFTLTAMWGLSYAILYEHLTLRPYPTPLGDARDARASLAYTAAEDAAEAEGREFTDTDEPAEEPMTAAEVEEYERSGFYSDTGALLEWLVTTKAGQQIVVYYAQCAEQGLVPENRIKPVARKLVHLIQDLLAKGEAGFANGQRSEGPEGQR